MIYIGIDPGVKNGWAVWDSQVKKFCEIRTFSFWELITNIETMNKAYDCRFYVEATYKIKAVWDSKGRPQPTNLEVIRWGKLCQNIGQNRQISCLILQWLERNHCDYIECQPGSSLTKLKPDTFKQMTKYKERTSQHGRDAAMLVWGR